MKKVFFKSLCKCIVVMFLLVLPVHAQEEGIMQEKIIEETDNVEKEEVNSEVRNDTEDEEGDDQGDLNDELEGAPVDKEDIIDKVINISDFNIIQISFKDGNTYAYTGKAITPVIDKVMFENEKGEIIAVSAVKIEQYKNNKDIGFADVVISIEGYEGTVTVKNAFEIVFGNVSSLKATPVTYDKTKLSWNKVMGANGYIIYRSTKSTSGFKALKTINSGSITLYSDTSVKMGTTYYYKIRAYRIVNGKKVYSGDTKPVKQKAQVATVKIASVKRASYNSITIKWKKISGASGYTVYRSTSEKGTYKKIATLKKGSKVTYIDKKCSCGTTYYYKVAAYRTSKKKNYYGNESAAVSANTTPDKTAFTSKTISGDTHALLRWEKSSGASGYTIYISGKQDSGYQEIKHVTKGTTLKWKSTGLNADQVYYYKIRPYVLKNGKKIYGSYSTAYKKELFEVKYKKLLSYTKVQYRSGGQTPAGWDCSGFTKWAMANLYGVEIEKGSSAQAKGGKSISTKDMSKWQAGDILVYAKGGRVNHVALYLGDGKMMHALNSKYDTVIQDVDYYEKWDKKNNLKYVRRYL